MNYKKHYDALIGRARTRILTTPTESHHVVPRCMKGGDGKKNRVNLTPSEHFVAHQLLVKMYPEVTGLATAAVLMCRDNRNGKRLNNKLYGWLRERAAEGNTIRQTGIPCTDGRKHKIAEARRNSTACAEYYESRRGVPRTEDERAKISAAHKTSPKAIAAREALRLSNTGRPKSAETRAKIGAAFKGGKHSDEHRAKQSAALKGKPKSAEHNASVSAALQGNQNAKGAVRSEETRAKIRLAATGRKMKPEDVAKMVANKTPEQRSAAAHKAWETKRAKAALLKENQNGL